MPITSLTYLSIRHPVYLGAHYNVAKGADRRFPVLEPVAEQGILRLIFYLEL